MQLNCGGGKAAVIFKIKFHPKLKCHHVNFLEGISLVKGADELLLLPYSGFKVVSTNFSPSDMSEIVIHAFHDNMVNDLSNVPLAPWH